MTGNSGEKWPFAPKSSAKLRMSDLYPSKVEDVY